MGRITGYASEVAFFAHAVAETGLEAMIGASPALPGPRRPDDLDNRRPLQRARRSLSPIGTVLKFLWAPTDFLVGPSGEA
jgi:hypothetical protein